MAKRDIRQYRQQKLETEGFLPFEAEYYSQFPLTHLGVRKIRRFRKTEIKRASRSGISDIPAYISASYRAKGFVNEKGRPQANLYSSAITSQLEKPYKDRQSVLIQPDRYNIFQQAVSERFPLKQALQLAESIPASEWNKRKQQYNQLIRSRYSPSEAIYIISAQTPPDKNGNRRLQTLDLEQDAWQKAMEERLAFFKQQVSLGIKKGMTQQKAISAAMREIDNWYKKDKDRKPFDEIEDISPSGPPKPEVDFADALKKRRAKQIKEKMPWRAKA